MPGVCILFEVIQYRPSQHVRQHDIQRDRGRTEFARQSKRLGACHGDKNLEALVARKIEKNAGVVWIVLYDQQHSIAVLQRIAIINKTRLLFRRSYIGEEHWNAAARAILFMYN